MLRLERYGRPDVIRGALCSSMRTCSCSWPPPSARPPSAGAARPPRAARGAPRHAHRVTREPVARRHIVGAVVFGIGWGVADACPGPIAARSDRASAGPCSPSPARSPRLLFMRRSLPETEHRRSSPSSRRKRGRPGAPRRQSRRPRLSVTAWVNDQPAVQLFLRQSSEVRELAGDGVGAA